MNTTDPSTDPVRVLIVEDEPTLRYAYERTLAHAGFDVLSAANGAGGIALVERDAPDIVLLDWMLPDMEGIDVCRRIKEDFPSTLVILVSGLRTSGDSQADGLDAGADGYLAKPIEPRALVAHVRALARIKESEKRLRALADELAESNRRLEEYNRLKAEFVANMSHELRTPLNAIIGFAQLMTMRSEPDPLPERVKDGVNRILRNSRHLLRLIDGVLDLSKIEAGHQIVFPEHFDLAEAVQAAFGELQSLARQKNLGYRLKVGGDLPIAFSDSLRVRQIVINLLSNAIKFTAEGSIEAELGRVDDARWRFTVRDSGIGIRPEQLDVIFDRFRQVDGSTTREAGGAGLGLTIVQELARKLGGTVDVSSTFGKGSIFSVILPFRLPEDDEPRRDPRFVDVSEIVADVEDGRPVVLVIEDDDDHVSLLHATLTAANYSVVVGRNATAGLDLARELVPSAIILDIMMPNIDGWRVLQAMKAERRTASIPVIVCSIVDNRPLGYQLGASDYLVKPVEPSQLLEALESVGASTNPTDGYVLVVDDEKAIRELVTTALRHAGFEVRTAASGEAALKIAAGSAPMAVLSDLVMPGGMSGFELIARLRANAVTDGTPIIVVTGKDVLPEDRKLMAGQIADVIRKGDLLLPDLETRLKETLEGHGVKPAHG